MNKQDRREIQKVATDLRNIGVVDAHTAGVVARAIRKLDNLLELHADVSPVKSRRR